MNERAIQYSFWIVSYTYHCMMHTYNIIYCSNVNENRFSLVRSMVWIHRTKEKKKAHKYKINSEIVAFSQFSNRTNCSALYVTHARRVAQFFELLFDVSSFEHHLVLFFFIFFFFSFHIFCVFFPLIFFLLHNFFLIFFVTLLFVCRNKYLKFEMYV